MATRVRKLARQLGRTPDEILETLGNIGFPRYRSPDDMVSDAVIQRLRQQLPQRRRLPPPPPAPTRGRPRTPNPPPTPSVALATASEEIEATRAQHEAEVRAFEEEKRRVAEEAEAVKAMHADVQHAMAALAAERAAFEAERSAWEQARADATSGGESADPSPLPDLPRVEVGGDPDTVLDLLEERGLRGRDEAERAIAALASAKELGPLLASMKPHDPDAVRRILSDRLVLIDTDVREGVRLPTVTVSADRADVPSADHLERALRSLGERLLLHGMRSVLWVDVPPRWHTYLSDGIDGRIRHAFRPSGPDVIQHLQADAPADIVVWVQGGPPAEVVDACRKAGARLVKLDGARLLPFVESLTVAIDR